MYYPGNWIHSFPQNFQWSNATLVCKGMAPYGAVALGEIDWIVQKLHQRADEPNAWDEEWCAVADKVAAAGDAAAKAGNSATAGNNYLRAGNYYYTGERMVPPGDLKTAIYRKALRCFQEGLTRRYPNLEIVDVPYEGSALPAYFLKSPYAKGPAPTVVLFDGLDNCKEMSVLFAGAELAYRGFHTLAIDGPGQGEALRLRNLPSRFDYEAAGTPAYEFVASRADVDAKRVAIMASMADHCLLDLLWRNRRGELDMSVAMVISNHPDLADQVRPFGVPFLHVPATADSRAHAEQRHLELMRGNVDLVVLARYMQIVTPAFLAEVGCPIINIHHSFLPAFLGAAPYRRAKERGVKLVGATAHYVTENLDEGPIIEQDVVRVDHRQGVQDLVRLGADVERLVLSRAVLWHCEDRIIRYGNQTVVF